MYGLRRVYDVQDQRCRGGGEAAAAAATYKSLDTGFYLPANAFTCRDARLRRFAKTNKYPARGG